MKCIKAIKESKYSKVGDIQRLTDSEAYQKVDTGFWEFVKKSEWKKITRIQKKDINTEEPIVVDKKVKEKKPKKVKTT